MNRVKYMEENKYNFIGIEETLKDIKEQSQTINNCVDKMNEIINDSIGQTGDAWKGISAAEFLNKWNEHVTDMKELVEIINKQTENIELVKQVMSEE